MRYIERILQPGEKLVFAGKIHWVIYIPAIIMLLLAPVSYTHLTLPTN